MLRVRGPRVYRCRRGGPGLLPYADPFGAPGSGRASPPRTSPRTTVGTASSSTKRSPAVADLEPAARDREADHTTGVCVDLDAIRGKMVTRRRQTMAPPNTPNPATIGQVALKLSQLPAADVPVVIELLDHLEKSSAKALPQTPAGLCEGTP